MTTPALVWLTADRRHAALPPRVTVVPVDDASWIERRQPGDRLEFVDSRGAIRHWVVVEARADGCMATATQTAYVSSGLELICTTGVNDDAVVVGGLPDVEQVHRVDTGDRLTLTRTLEPAIPTVAGSHHRIGCTLPEVFDHTPSRVSGSGSTTARSAGSSGR